MLNEVIHNLQGHIEYHKKLEKIRPKGCRKEIKINFEHTEQTKNNRQKTERK